ncbi:hypothetical protein BVRB_025000, partial [Beta vulgaris subsp. vulgaris]
MSFNVPDVACSNPEAKVGEFAGSVVSNLNKLVSASIDKAEVSASIDKAEANNPKGQCVSTQILEKKLNTDPFDHQKHCGSILKYFRHKVSSTPI